MAAIQRPIGFDVHGEAVEQYAIHYPIVQYRHNVRLYHPGLWSSACRRASLAHVHRHTVLWQRFSDGSASMFSIINYPYKTIAKH